MLVWRRSLYIKFLIPDSTWWLSPGIASDGCDPYDSPRRSSCTSPHSGCSCDRFPGALSGRSCINLDVLRTWSPRIGVSDHFSAFSPLSHWVFEHEFLASPSSSAPRGILNVSFPNAPANNTYPKIFRAKLSSRIDEDVTGRRIWVSFDYWTKRNYRSFEWFTKSPFTMCCAVWQAVNNVSQITVTLHGICTPLFVQSRLQQYSQRSFFDSA